MTNATQIATTRTRPESAPTTLQRLSERAVTMLRGVIVRHRTRRALAALPPERLEDCGIDPAWSRTTPASPEEARRSTYLMSLL